MDLIDRIRVCADQIDWHRIQRDKHIKTARQQGYNRTAIAKAAQLSESQVTRIAQAD